MTISRPVYVTREEVKAALSAAETARTNDQVDRALGSATDAVDGHLRRRFRPWVGTRYFDWPDDRYRTPWRLWLDEHDLITIDTVTSGGTTIPPGDLLPGPANSGPPYRYLEIDRSTSSTFTAGATHQRAIAVGGTWGWADDEEAIGQLAGSLAADDNATASVTWSTAHFGVGDLLRIDDERILIADKSMVDTGHDTTGALDNSNAEVTVGVPDGSAFAVGQVLLIDAERMLVVDVAGTNLIVKRAWDGSVLAAHNSAASVYALTGVTLRRAQCGTTLAVHDAAATIYRHLVPDLVRDLTLGYALNQLLQEGAGYARTSGMGENQIEVSGRGLGQLKRDAAERFGRQILQGAV